METVALGRTGLNVSVLVFGTWVTGGWAWGGADERDALNAILGGLEKGVNFIDTAPVYGFGKSEEIVGQALKEWGNRDSVVVATKCALEWDDARQKIWRNSSPGRIRYEVDQSLKRLGVDVIDLYQLHWPDAKTPFEDSMEAMTRLRDEGKIRAIGVSNFDKEQMEACLKAGPLHTLQPPYNLFERGAEEETLPFCQEQDIGTLVYGGLCRGLLSGKFTGEEKFPKGDLRRGDPKFKPDKFKQYVKAVDAMKELAAKYGKTMPQFALRWALQQPGVTTVIAGARTPGQAEENAGVFDWRIEEEDLRKVEDILRKHVKTPVGPEFMAPPV